MTVCIDPWCSSHDTRHEHVDGDPDRIRVLPGEPGWPADLTTRTDG